MSQVQLPQFQSKPEGAAGLMTLDDARFLIARGWLTPEGAQYLLPNVAWQNFPHIELKQKPLNTLPSQQQSSGTPIRPLSAVPRVKPRTSRHDVQQRPVPVKAVPAYLPQTAS